MTDHRNKVWNETDWRQKDKTAEAINIFDNIGILLSLDNIL